MLCVKIKYKREMDLKYLSVIVSLLVIGCSQPIKPEQVFVNEMVDSIAYTQDKKTGICFAIFHDLGVTEVPCEKVKDHLQKTNKRKWP